MSNRTIGALLAFAVVLSIALMALALSVDVGDGSPFS